MILCHRSFFLLFFFSFCLFEHFICSSSFLSVISRVLEKGRQSFCVGWKIKGKMGEQRRKKVGENLEHTTDKQKGRRMKRNRLAEHKAKIQENNTLLNFSPVNGYKMVRYSFSWLKRKAESEKNELRKMY